ncbi:MAG: hypothetical protein JW999_11260 [Methanotrichaceae archaeon]|nr:hypothetical protein [Methanotrichaceae archaeon]
MNANDSLFAALTVSPRILVRCLRKRGRSPQGPHACACPRPVRQHVGRARSGGPGTIRPGL